MKIIIKYAQQRAPISKRSRAVGPLLPTMSTSADLSITLTSGRYTSVFCVIVSIRPGRRKPSVAKRGLISCCIVCVIVRGMSAPEEVTENLTAQVSELQALQSVYPTELAVADYGVLADINEYIECPDRDPPRWLEYTIAIPLNSGSIELLVSLPTNYPKEQPEVYAKGSCLDRTQQCLLNKELSIVVKAQEAGEPCIYTLISWLQDNAETYLEASVCNQAVKHSDASKSGTEDRTSVVFSRYWIYSHHIYSKFKRRDVANLTKENSVTGFCLAGKPGIICMEGSLEDCDYCWQKIRIMNWHRILIKLLEKEEDCNNVDRMRKFTDFQEVSFPTTERHNDMGQLFKYLTDHDCQHAFKELFGIEGKFSKLSD